MRAAVRSLFFLKNRNNLLISSSIRINLCSSGAFLRIVEAGQRLMDALSLRISLGPQETKIVLMEQKLTLLLAPAILAAGSLTQESENRRANRCSHDGKDKLHYR